MIELAPFEVLFEASSGTEMPLPPELVRLYGALRLPRHEERAHVSANFVASLDGVVTLDVPGRLGGGEISGRNRHDRALMGLLRACADAVVVGAGTLRATSNTVYTAANVYPPLAEQYARVRSALGHEEPPLNVVITARGELDTTQRLFQSGEVPVLVVTTEAGAGRLRERKLPGRVRLEVVAPEGFAGARALLAAICRDWPCQQVLVEGGPHLMAALIDERLLDELFLTLAPQVVGRADGPTRPAFVAGRLFAPERPVWTQLASLRRAESHLFLRYRFSRD